MRLSVLLDRPCAPDPEIFGVTSDSRKVAPGFLFCAVDGTRVQGHSFIPAALQAGAVAIVAGRHAESDAPGLIRVEDPARAYAIAAARLAGTAPTICLAVTGTNGKTSVASFVRQILSGLGRDCASLGTLGLVVSRADGREEILTSPGMTTPDAADLAALLARLKAMGVEHLCLEASSHGIEQRRLDGVRLTAAGFTNLTQDHLDYHLTMKAYGSAKARLFDTLIPAGGAAVINLDSAGSEIMVQAARRNRLSLMTVGSHGSSLRLVSVTPSEHGQCLILEAEGRRIACNLPLIGRFQAENALVAAGLCMACGEGIEPVIASLEKLKGAEGRLQKIGSVGNSGAYVDYAHTPDGLESLLKSLRPHTPARLIVVFGAGGDRDRTKRPLMGAIATRFADKVIVTDDNPRTEDAALIRQAILASCPGALEIADRRAAIRQGVDWLESGDILVVAGKGHEQGQIVGSEILPFCDAEELRIALGRRGGLID